MRSLRAAIDWFAGSPARSFVFIFLVAFSVRAIALTRVPESWVTPSGGGQEDKIAVSLLEHGEYSSTCKVRPGPRISRVGYCRFRPLSYLENSIFRSAESWESAGR